VRRPGLRLLVGLGVLTGGGWLLGEGLRTTVRNLSISKSLLGNTAVGASVEAEEIARVACRLAAVGQSSGSASARPSSTSRRLTRA
jgi:hypothetical protein